MRDPIRSNWSKWRNVIMRVYWYLIARQVCTTWGLKLEVVLGLTALIIADHFSNPTLPKPINNPSAQTVRTVPNGNEDSMVKTAIVLTILTEFPEEWPGRRLSHWPNVLKDVISLLMRFFDNSSQVSLGSRCEFCFAYHDRVLMSLYDHLSNRLECCFYSCKWTIDEIFSALMGQLVTVCVYWWWLCGWNSQHTSAALTINENFDQGMVELILAKNAMRA